MPFETPPGSPDAENAVGGGPSPALLEAVRRLLRPLVRLLLQHQITFPALAGLLKSVYVQVADEHFAIPERPQTISRLTLLTGIHRKDVRRLQSEAAETGVPATSTASSLGAQLVLRWTTEPDFLTPEGAPRALPRLAGNRTESSFEALVASVTQDIRPRAILDEWLRLGVASVDAQDRVHLAEAAFVPARGFDEKAYFLGRNVRDHLDAARHNLSGEGDPFLERSVYYAGLRAESAQELQALSRTVGIEALQRVNQRARVLQQADEGAPESRYRMSFGAWFLRAPLAGASPVSGLSSESNEGPEGGSDAS